MNELARRLLPFMTTDEFLAWAWTGDGTGRTFQLVDGEVQPVSPASDAHAVISSNLNYLLNAAVRTAGLKLVVRSEGAIIPRLNASTNVRVPDILVSAVRAARKQQTVPEPILVVEVLSPSNAQETRDNVRAYATLRSVQEMAIVDSIRLRAEVYRRDEAGEWAADPEIIEPEGRLRLPSVGLDCAIEDAYVGTWLEGDETGEPPA